MTMLTQMQLDTTLILSDWLDSLLIERNTIDVTNAIPVDSWATVATYYGDWQPYIDRNEAGVLESGKNDLYDSRIFLQYDADVKNGDRINKDTTYCEYVQKVLKYEDHIEVLTTRNKNSL